MHTRRDQVQAYRFAIQRVVAALLHGEPDAAESPMRRIVLATFSSVMVGVLALAGVGIYGLLRPGGNDTWKEPNTLIVEKGTATRFIYADGVLHPVTNYASARLLLGPTAETVFVDGKSLGNTPRGSTIGLVNAPDALPAPGDLTTGPWVACTRPVERGAGSLITVSVGSRPRGFLLGPTDGLLASTSRGTTFLLWNNTKLRLPNPEAVATALNLNLSSQVYAVDDGWINAIPPGPDLRPITIDGLGEPGPTTSRWETRVGQVAVVTGQAGANNQYFVVLRDSLAPITETDARLLLNDRQVLEQSYSGQTARFLELSTAEVSPLRSAAIDTPGFPKLLPALRDASLGGPRVLCAAFDGGDGQAARIGISVTDKAPGVPAGVSSARATEDLADYVAVPPSGGALVRGMSTDNQATSAVYLVSNLGVKFPVTSADAKERLGYSGVSPDPVPNTLLDLIPQGVALDPEAANQQLPAAAGSGPN